MNPRTSKEISAEIEQYSDMISTVLSKEGGIFILDLKYFAQIVGDLKQELRLAEIRERNHRD